MKTDRTTVLIYCTECGNRRSRTIETGEEHDTVFRVTATQLAMIQADLPMMKCAHCEGQMGVKVLESSD